MKNLFSFPFSLFSYLLFFTLSSSHPAHAVAFSSPDLAGEWSGYFLESTGGSSYWIYGEMTVDQAGIVTGGSWTAASRTTGTFVGGSLSLDRGGVLTGTLRTHETGSSYGSFQEMTLVHGKMDQGKDLVQGVVLKDNGNMDLVTLVRKGTASFAASDIDGDWFAFLHNTDAGGAADHLSVDMTIQQDGTLADTTWESSLTGVTGALSGTFALDTDTGAVSWNLLSSHFDAGDSIIRSTLVSQSAQLTASKSVFAGVNVRENSGFMDFSLYIKAGGAVYQTTDLQGTWAGYFVEILDGLVYWIYGAITVDGDGNITGGRWEAVSGTTGTFTGGNVSLDPEGKLSGTLSSSDNRVMTVQSGYMDAGKSIITAVTAKDNGASDLVCLLKMEPDFFWPMFLPSITSKY